MVMSPSADTDTTVGSDSTVSSTANQVAQPSGFLGSTSSNPEVTMAQNTALFGGGDLDNSNSTSVTPPVANPITASSQASNTTPSGFTNTGQQQTAAPADNGGGLLGNAAQGASTAVQLGAKLNPGKSLVGGVTSAINNFGGTLGFGGAAETVSPGLAAADAAATPGGISTLVTASGEPISAAGAITSASLSSVLGAAGIGAMAGGFLASAIGENSVGGSIGGGLGAGIGEAFGASAAAALGINLGMFAGPLGAVAGGVLGAVVGGLFGNTKPTDGTEISSLNPATGQYQYQAGTSDQGSKFSQANQTLTSNAGQGAQNLSSFLLKNGATVNPNAGGDLSLVFKVGSRDGYQVLQASDASKGQLSPVSNAGENQAQFYTNVAQATMAQYNIPPALQSQLNSMNLNSFFGQGGSTQASGGTTVTPSTSNVPTLGSKTASSGSFANFVQQYNSNGNNAPAASQQSSVPLLSVA